MNNTTQETTETEGRRKATAAYEAAIADANKAFEMADGKNRKAYVKAVDKADKVHIAAHIAAHKKPEQAR